MKDNHSTRDAMAVFNPNPFTHMAKQDYNLAMIEQLETILQAAKNLERIMELKAKLKDAQRTSDELSGLF